MTHFAYEDRDDCICGARLESAAGHVTRSFAWGPVTFVRCAACGSWCQRPLINRASIAQWFDSAEYHGGADRPGLVYASYVDEEKSRLLEARDRWEADLRPLVPPRARILEIGCATGSMLATLREHGCSVVGVDLSPTFAAAAREMHGLNVMVGDVIDIDLPEQSFDVILLLGTFGNLPDPVRYLRRLGGLLRPGGRLIFNFADAASTTMKYLYRSHAWMLTPSVGCFMTSEGCRRAVQRAGLNVVSMRRDRQRPSIAKLLTHGGLKFLLPLAHRTGLATRALPVRLPMPAIKLVCAQ